MSVTSAVLRELARAGLNLEQVLAAAERIEQAERPRSSTDRVRAFRERQQDETRNAKRVTVTSPPDKEAPQTPQEINPLTPDNSPTGNISTPTKTTPRSELAAVLDEEHVAAVLEHRQRLHSPLTPRAAKMLARQFGECPDPNAAADEMLSRGWRGFKPEWLNGHQSGPGPPREPTFSDIRREAERQLEKLDRPEQ